MFITERTPDILFKMKDFYKKHNDRGDAVRMYEACIFHNNMPVNSLQAVKVLADISCMIRIDILHPVEFEYCLRYLSEVTGYSVIELSNKLEVYNETT